ncbi:MAG: SusC/RagA family TonB-linked outer membrane protein [Algoriphagus sp.]
MRKYIYDLLILGIFLIVGISSAIAQSRHEVSGKVIDEESGEAIPGILIRLTPAGITQVTGDQGEFLLTVPEGEQVLVFSHLSYETYELDLIVGTSNSEGLEIKMQASDMDLEGVEVVSTGYQQLPKERVTGSFVQLDNELVNRSVTTDVLQRLENVTPGLIFNKDGSDKSNSISIRGTSTIFADSEPLIIIDNFPYDGSIDNINPNDVESITVLKDAAAASIWGARAGNGVIVITTKSASYGQGMKVSFNANITVSEKPDLFHNPQMTVSDFVDVEELLFDQGFYSSRYNSNRNPLVSPVVVTLYALENGQISESEAQQQMDSYRSTDLRTEITKHLLRPAVNQQYALNISGGGKASNHTFSLGYDKNMFSDIGNQRNRLTINSQNNWKFLNDKLTVMAGIYLSRQTNEDGAPGTGGLDPYAKLVDSQGNPMPVYSTWSNRYVQAAQENGFLDWQYVPLNEVGLDPLINNSQDLRLNARMAYQIIPGLSAEFSYQYWQNQGKVRQLFPLESFFTRNLINTYTQIDDLGAMSYPIPQADILDASYSSANSHTYRGMLSFDKVYQSRHAINAIAGFEVRDFGAETHNSRNYAYSDETGLVEPVDYLTRWRKAPDRFPANIPFLDAFEGQTDRYLSAYLNAGYTLDQKYSVTASLRRDASNLFGVSTNQKFVPLWSAGLGYTISEERFFNVPMVDFLRIRASYGYNGNTDKGVAALPSGRLFPGSRNFFTYLPYTRIDLPGNPDLRWERIQITNIGMDFNLFKDRVSGTFEWYAKSGQDIIGDYSIPSSTGFSSLRGNYANTITKGFDLSINVSVLQNELKWNTVFFVSHLNEKVSKYEGRGLVSNYLNYGSGTGSGFPFEGRPLTGVYSYAWAGLDAQTGAPMGILEGQESKEYSAIIGQTGPEGRVFHGSGRPTWFGALRNDLQYGNFSLSINISYRLGYFIRRTGIDYYNLLGGEYGHGDYEKRWMNPGDELGTEIPAMPESRDFQQSSFYLKSAALIERGDHIRLQDIRLAYALNSKKKWMNNTEFYSYMNNVGILWKKSEAVSDPDNQFSRPLRSIALGLRMNF